jgi:hypothetical protein
VHVQDSQNQWAPTSVNRRRKYRKPTSKSDANNIQFACLRLDVNESLPITEKASAYRVKSETKETLVDDHVWDYPLKNSTVYCIFSVGVEKVAM